MNVTIPKLNRATDGNPFTAPGPWWTVLQDGPRRSATVRCPKCETRQTLTEHEIGDDGRVTPSLQCASEGCDYHVMATLEGWEPRAPT